VTGGWHGLLLVDKPAGPTSHDVVDVVRRLTGQRRAGHAGTLDPAATGLLPIVLGCATRLVRFLPASPKVYQGILVLGLTTETDDVSGAVLERHAGALPAPGAVAAAAGALEGSQLQLPPAYSARKLGGERMYRLARRGARVIGAARPIEVHDFRVEATGQADRFRFEVTVTAGTYVRALVRDLGRKLGCGAALAALRRTRIGSMAVEDALALSGAGSAERLAPALVAPERMPLLPPPHRLDDDELARSFCGGASIDPPGLELAGPVAVYDPAGRLLGIGESAAGRLRPRVVVAAPPVPPRGAAGRSGPGASG